MDYFKLKDIVCTKNMSEYNNLIKALSEGGDAMLNILTPLTPYILCDYYMVDEIFSEPPEENSNLSLRNLQRIVLHQGNAQNIKDYDKIFIQTDKLEYFVNNIMPHISSKFVLFTGKNNLPQVHHSYITDNLLKDERLVLWFSQNPIYIKSDKYIPFGYGVNIWNNAVYDYAKALLDQYTERKHILGFFNLNIGTNPCRKNLTGGLKFNTVYEYFLNISNYSFMISPIGDRDECHRHWECIGMGTVPISNVGELYKQIFGKNMIYVKDEHDFRRLIDTNGAELEGTYEGPNRNLITVEYWRNYVDNAIKGVRGY